MNRFVNAIRLAAVLAFVITGCTIVKSDDPQKSAREFLKQFQDALAASDDDVMAYFKVKQSREAVLSVINILRNTDTFVTCDTYFQDAVISPVEDVLYVEIPVQFRAGQEGETEPGKLTLQLAKDGDSYAIVQLDGETFYQQYQQIKNRNAWQEEQQDALQARSMIYENARMLESKFDSVVWYVTYNEQPYFYVISGPWTNFFLGYDTRKIQNEEARMGLVDAEGEVIIPIEYDLIGTLGFERPNEVEVQKDGLVGVFDLEQKRLLVDPLYERIIPYDKDSGVKAVVYKDGKAGWLDRSYSFHEGYSSQAMENYLVNYEFLKKNIKLGKDYATCEIPREDYAGSGIIIPPVYLSQYGIFNPIEGGICTTTYPLNGYTEYIAVEESVFTTITDQLSLLMTTIQERYLEGREEFYTKNTLTFMSPDGRRLGNSDVEGSISDIELRSVDSTLLEVKSPHDYWFMESCGCVEMNLPHYQYFSVTTDGVTLLETRRLYGQTAFVKLDSSFLAGSFTVYNQQTEQTESTNFLSYQTIRYMRDEILADNGYIIPPYVNEADENTPTNTFDYVQTDKTLTDDLAAVMGSLSETDRHNVEFLNRILELMQPSA